MGSSEFAGLFQILALLFSGSAEAPDGGGLGGILDGILG